MTRRLTQIWRFPIKSHGRERLETAHLTAGQCLPWDRHWAVAHEESAADGTTWVACSNFSRGAKAPGLAAITAELDEATATVTLRHPDRDALTFRPDEDGDKLIAWAGGFVPKTRAQSARVVRGQARGFTDSDFASVTLCNTASHRAVEDHMGRALSIHRWRGNLWFDGAAAWEEFDWIGHEIRIGEALLVARERTNRCLATHADPETGQRDGNVLATLDGFGHRDFSIRAEVRRGGRIAPGDVVEVI